MTNVVQRWKRVWAHDAWIKPFLGQYRKTLAASLALGLLTMVFAAGLMFVSGFLISDAAEQPAQGLYSLLVPLGLVQVFGVGKPFLGYLERLTSHDWVLRITSRMRLTLYNTVEANGMFWTATHRAGDALGLLTADIGHVQNLYLRTVFPLLISWLIWIVVVILVGAFSPVFGLFMLVAIGVLVLLLPLVSVLVNGARQFRAKAYAQQRYANTYDQIAGLADWTFAQRKEEYLSRIMEADARVAQENTAIARSSRNIDLAGQVVFGLTATALLVWAALHFDSTAQAAAATGVAGRPADWVAAFVLGFFPLTEAFAPLPAATVEANAHLDSLERLNQQSQLAQLPQNDFHSANNATAEASDQGEDNPATSKTGGNASQGRATTDKDRASSQTMPAMDKAGSQTPRAPKIPLPTGSPAVVLDSVRFAYPQEPEVVKGLSLSIQPGQKVAILGPSGSGKSTLISLIRGDRAPQEGSISLRFEGGTSLAPSRLGDDICSYISLVQQSTYLFNQSLYQNLALGDKTISREDAAAALEAVGLGPLLERLPKGLSTIVDQAGFRFSGGERHRIALARVLLRNTPVVLLDEPTVSLDPLTEQELLRTMFTVLEGKTVIIVTHHLAGVEQMDRVVFLDEGCIAMEGSPQQLQAENPRYRQLLAFDRG